jgi:hypothetical protein
MTSRENDFVTGIKQELITNKEEVKELIDMIICCICLDVVKVPLECSECEALYCKDCWEEIKVTKEQCAFKCVSKIKPINKYFRENVLSKIKLRCEICNAPEMNYNLYLKHISYCRQHSKFVIQADLDELIKEKEKRVQELKNEIRKNLILD